MRRWFLLPSTLAVVLSATSSLAEETVVARSAAPVHVGPARFARVVARLAPGAEISGRFLENRNDCPRGWFERTGGGYVCGAHLAPEGGGAGSAPSSPAGTAVLVDSTVRVFRHREDIAKHDPLMTLLPSSVLRISGEERHQGLRMLRTVDGLLVDAEGTRVAPIAPTSLALRPQAGEVVHGFVGHGGATVRAEPRDDAVTVGTLARWTRVVEAPVEARDGWFRLAGGFVHDRELLRVRPPDAPAGLAADERWIAVDLAEQLLLAFVGQRLVLVAPCSTGKKGNTFPGTYRLELKRRAQTMRLRRGRVRVDDVPWVMYYERQGGYAIHSAYWHESFGTPVSHGCVNLPTDDARWLYEWTAPAVVAGDGERVAWRGDPGTRVVIFR